jgi:hypothetical protein
MTLPFDLHLYHLSFLSSVSTFIYLSIHTHESMQELFSPIATYRIAIIKGREVNLLPLSRSRSAMAASLKMASLVAAVLLLLVATPPQARGIHDHASKFLHCIPGFYISSCELLTIIGCI